MSQLEQLEELKTLIAEAESHAVTSVEMAGKRIASCVKIGGRLAALKSEMGKGWQAWRDENLPEATLLEKGCIKLAVAKEKQPDLFADVGNMVKLGRWAGIIPQAAGRKVGRPKRAHVLIGAAINVLCRLLGHYVPDGEGERLAVKSALAPVVAWVRKNLPEAMEVAE